MITTYTLVLCLLKISSRQSFPALISDVTIQTSCLRFPSASFERFSFPVSMNGAFESCP